MKKQLIIFLCSFCFISYAQKENKGLEMQFMDLKTRPQDDFYQYVNGGWVKNAVIPPEKDIWGSFYELRDKNDVRTLGILKKAVGQVYSPNSDERKVVDYFLTITDMATRNAQKLSPIRPFLQKIDAIRDLPSLQRYLIEGSPYGMNPLFRIYARADMKNSEVNAAFLGSADLGLDRDYYQKSDPTSKEKIRKYQNYVAKMLRYLDQDGATAISKAKKIVDLETRLAKAMLPREELRDAKKLYNPYAIKALEKLAPTINWGEYFSGIGLKNLERVIVTEPRYLKTLDEVLRTVSLERVKDLLRWHVLNDAAPRLSSDLEQDHFDFYSKTLKGVLKMESLERRALDVVNRHIGEPLGRLYIKEVFPPQAKEDVQKLVQYLSDSYRERIKNLSWMGKRTKKAALDKLAKFTVKIGYPDEGGWKDYSALTIKSKLSGGAYYTNYLNLKKWDFQDHLKKIGQPVNRKEWYSNPQTVNAYYTSENNEIVFPAAILQLPFYDLQRDAAMNFGAIGGVIGHELSHGFDDSGSQFDGDGNFRNWWQAEDKKRFDALAMALAEQYDSYTPLPNMHINGRATLGENIADLGGVNIAYDALQRYLKDKGDSALISGFTPSQRFFISKAAIWRIKIRDEALMNQIKTDYHAPGKYRVIGSIGNVDGFYQAFDVKKGDRMYKSPGSRIKIW